MDAIMTVLAAVLLANADGRSARLLHALIAQRQDKRRVVAIFFASFALLAVVSAGGALIAAYTLGLGVLNLFAAMALGSAAGALLWAGRQPHDTTALTDASPFGLAVRLGAIQLGDRNQFLIFGLAPLSGAVPWAIVGGLIGLLLAMLPVLALGPAVLERSGAKWARWTAAALLLIWATVLLRRAFGV
mgnify:FL=1